MKPLPVQWLPDELVLIVGIGQKLTKLSIIQMQ